MQTHQVQQYDANGQNLRRWGTIAVLVVLLSVVLVGSLIWGSVSIPWETIVNALWNNHIGSQEMIVWNIRFPRNLIGALVGANLAVAGAILRAVMKIR